MRGALQLLWPLALLARTCSAQLGVNATSTAASSSAPAAAATPYKLQTPPLDTPWTDQVGLHPWPEHPRPQLRRARWQSLNGLWTWQSAGTGNSSGVPSAPVGGPLTHEVLVPFCIESALSGLQDLNTTSMWYATTFAVPSGWGGQNVVLHFEAVDYEHTVFVNGQQAGFFRGGYFRHSIDVTSYLRSNGTNELYVGMVCAFLFEDEPWEKKGK